MKEKTVVSDWLEERKLGFVVNAGFSEKNSEKFLEISEALASTFEGAIYRTPKNGLHVTLMDWIAPLIDYGQDKKELFEKVRDSYDRVLSQLLDNQPPIKVVFDEIAVFPNTVVALGHDDGSFQRIRNAFVEQVELLPDTKLPPKIIHSSLCRFTQEIDLDDVKEMVAGLNLNTEEVVDNFRLVKTMQEPMLDFEVIKNYKLAA